MEQSVDLSKAESAYGSYKAWARRLGVPYTTVMGWKDAKNVPHWRTDRVLEIARADGHDIARAARSAKRGGR